MKLSASKTAVCFILPILMFIGCSFAGEEEKSFPDLSVETIEEEILEKANSQEDPIPEEDLPKESPVNEPSEIEKDEETDENPSFEEEVYPEAVKGLEAQTYGTQVLLTWSFDPVADGYLVYAMGEGEERYLLEDVKENYYFHHGVSSESYTFYWVFPYVKNGDKTALAPVGPYVFAKGGVNYVSNIIASAQSPTEIKVVWEESSDAYGYIVTYGVNGNLSESAYTVEPEFTLENAEPNTYYYFRVYPYYLDGKGNEIVGESKEYVYVKTTFKPVSDLKGKSIDLEKVFLQWDEVPGADGYAVFRALEDSPSFQYLYYTDKTSFADLQAKYDKYNFYKVYPVASKGNGTLYILQEGEYVYAKPQLYPVRHLSAVNEQGYARLQWERVPYAQGYRLLRRSGSDQWEVIRELGGNVTTILDREPAFADNNFYILLPSGKVEDKTVYGPQSTYAFMKPVLNKTTPKVTSEEKGISLQWKGVPRATGYRIYRKSEMGDRELLSEVSSTSYLDEDASIGYFHYYWVIPFTEEKEQKFSPPESDYSYAFRSISITGPGGIEYWLKPNGEYTIAGKADFPKGLPWVSHIAHEVKDWMVEHYKDRYNLGGYILDNTTGQWLAPVEAKNRSYSYDSGSGLDCVGFLNGWTYLYTRALAGEDYKTFGEKAEDSSGVYGPITLPSGKFGFIPWVVIKPVIDGTYADENHIRPGDFNESTTHVWLVSDEGEGVDAKVWEYAYGKGFDDGLSVEDLKTTPYNMFGSYIEGYKIVTAANPMESYGAINLMVTDEQDKALDGGVYKVVDEKGRTLRILGDTSLYWMYRPGGNEFYNALYNHYHNDTYFYDEGATFTTSSGKSRITQVIGSKYTLVEISPPTGYRKTENRNFTLEPGEDKTILLKYTALQ